MMKLVSITLKNFRCYKDEKRIEFGDFTSIIGRNDIGKSTILEALEIFFNNESVKIDNNDCSISAADKTIEITCEFSELPERLVLDTQADTSFADEFLLAGKDNLKIRKTYTCTGAKPKEEVFICSNHPTADQYHDLLELTNTALKKRLKDLNIDKTNVLLNSNPSIRKAIWGSCPDLQFSEVIIPLSKEDGKRVWDNISKYLPIFALFQSDRSSRDSDSEVQDPMKLAISTALAEPEIQQKLTDVITAVRAKACELADRTHKALSKIDPGLAAQLTPEFKSDPKWAGVFSLELTSDEGIPVNKRGSGVRRLILVSFFRAEAERRAEESGSKNIIYAVEEPETSQHPHNQKILLESLQDLSLSSNCQVIITTHSPGFASFLPIDSFRFVRKGADNQPLINTATNETWEEISKTLGVVPDNRVCVLLCVEGPTDVDALKCLSRALSLADPTIPDLSCDPRVAFVVLGGGTLSHWVNNHYLKGFGRPEVHIYDGDVSNYAASIAEVNSRSDGSWGIQTKKYEIENYLHADAINEGLSLTLTVNDTDDIPNLIKTITSWNSNTAKKRLSQYAFPKMNAERITERDPEGEVKGWLLRIGTML